MGLIGGLLGWAADDERLPHYVREAEEAGLEVIVRIVDIGADHPNTYKLTLYNDAESRTLTALSTGGGIIRVVEIDGARVGLYGDYYETLVYVEEQDPRPPLFEKPEDFEEIRFFHGPRPFFKLKSVNRPDTAFRNKLLAHPAVLDIRVLSPVLPILSYNNMSVPFQTCSEMMAYNADKNLSLWELAVHYERARGNITEEEVLTRIRNLVRSMQKSIDFGLAGTSYRDRILGCQSVFFKEKMDRKQLIENDMVNRIILYVTAIMEAKSAMGVFVAAPTAGSCGALPGACLGVAATMGFSEDDVVKAMLAAGLIGVFITTGASFAAEVGGCQAECGSGSGMAAAAIVLLAGGTLEQSLTAASMALQNAFGMTCDPVANRVEVPCLGKNVMAATNALSCANMALAGFDAVIPLDEVIEAMDRVGKSLPHTLRCTALGGLSITDTSRRIEKRLKEQGN